MENFLRGHVHAFQDWAGPPESFSTTISAAPCWNAAADQIHFNPRLMELCAHYHFVARPCQVRAGNQKGRVERAIRYVRDSFWAGRPFTTLAECNRQALVWRDQIAHQRPWPDDDTAPSPRFSPKNSRACCRFPAPLPHRSIVAVRSAKTIYVRFDLNDYSIPPEAVGRPLTLVASDTHVRILDGTAEIARHHRCYDRHQLVLDPAHAQALRGPSAKLSSYSAPAAWRWPCPRVKRCWIRPSRTENRPAAKPHNCSNCWILYGAAALRGAIREALERNTPRASSVAFLLRKQQRSAPQPAVDLSRHPEAQSIDVRPHDLETYDELAHRCDDDPDQ